MKCQDVLRNQTEALSYLKGLPTPYSFNTLVDVWNSAIDTAAEEFGDWEGTDYGVTDKFTIEEVDYE